MASAKKFTLTIQQRLDILKELETLPISTVAAKYRVHSMTVRRIQKKAASIMEFAEKDVRQKKRRRLRKPLYEELEKRLFTWFLEKRQVGDCVSDAILLEKAAEIKDSMASCSNFKVSQGWLANFKRRHNIRLLNTYDEKANVDEDAAKLVVENLMKMIKEENLNMENIYNLGESGLMWKALPSKTLAQASEKYVSEYKIRKERMTLALCVNATGNNKIMPLIIYKYNNPRALKHCKNKLPVIFKSRKNAWMDQSLFLDWFENYFKPCVYAYQLEKQIYGKVVLLLDDADRHKLDTKRLEDDYFKIIYLPQNSTSLIQPMDQGIFEKVKRSFRHKMLQSVLIYNGEISQFYKNYTIKDCLELIHAAWVEMSDQHIKNAWKKIITDLPALNIQETDEKNIFKADLENFISKITGEELAEGHATHFLSACAEAEKTPLIQEEEEKEEQEEEDNNNSENEEYEEETFRQEIQNEATRNELKYIFQRLECLSTNTPRYIRFMLEGLKLYFLDDPEH